MHMRNIGMYIYLFDTMYCIYVYIYIFLYRDIGIMALDMNLIRKCLALDTGSCEVHHSLLGPVRDVPETRGLLSLR